MNKDTVWYGFLDAGAKASPVALDNRLETGNTKTMYLYNLKRQEFVEYNRAIVEPKLREFNAKEKSMVEELKSAFNKARQDFKPKGNRIPTKTDLSSPAAGKPPAQERFDQFDEAIETDTDVELDDDDWVDDDE